MGSVCKLNAQKQGNSETNYNEVDAPYGVDHVQIAPNKPYPNKSEGIGHAHSRVVDEEVALEILGVVHHQIVNEPCCAP